MPTYEAIRDTPASTSPARAPPPAPAPSARTESPLFRADIDPYKPPPLTGWLASAQGPTKGHVPSGVAVADEAAPPFSAYTSTHVPPVYRRRLHRAATGPSSTPHSTPARTGHSVRTSPAHHGHGPSHRAVDHSPSGRSLQLGSTTRPPSGQASAAGAPCTPGRTAFSPDELPARSCRARFTGKTVSRRRRRGAAEGRTHPPAMGLCTFLPLLPSRPPGRPVVGHFLSTGPLPKALSAKAWAARPVSQWAPTRTSPSRIDGSRLRPSD